MDDADRSRWPVRKLHHGAEEASKSWTLHLSRSERLEAMWQLIVDGAAVSNAGLALRSGPRERLSTDESEFRRDLVRVIKGRG